MEQSLRRDLLHFNGREYFAEPLRELQSPSPFLQLSAQIVAMAANNQYIRVFRAFLLYLFLRFLENNVIAITDNSSRVAETKFHEMALPHPFSLGHGRCHSGNAAGACTYARRHCSTLLRRRSACR